MKKKGADYTFSQTGASGVGMDTSRWASLLLMGSDSREAPALPASSGKETSKPHKKDRPRLSAEKGLSDDPCVNGKRKKQRKHDWNGKIVTDIISSPGTNKFAKIIMGGNGDSAVVGDPSNAQARHPSIGNGSSINVDNSCNGSNVDTGSNGKKQKQKTNNTHRLSGDVEANNMAREVPSSSPPDKTEPNSSSISLTSAAARAGKTGKKRKRKATNNFVNEDAEGSLGVRPTRVSSVVNGRSRHAHGKDHRIGRMLSSPDNLPAGTERPRPNSLNLAYQTQKAAAELGGDGKGKWKLGGSGGGDGQGGDAKGGAEQNVPLAERTQYVGLDCEMVGVGPQGRRSALARCCLVDWDGNVIYDKHVNPAERVTDFRTFVSGVKAKHLKGALSLRQCQKEVATILKNKFLVGHALSNDLKALMMTHPQRMTRDTATYRPYRKPRSKAGGKLLPMSLKKLALEHLGRTIQEGQHHPAEDARAAMDLYKLVRTDWEKSLTHKGKKKGRRATVNQTAL